MSDAAFHPLLLHEGRFAELPATGLTSAQSASMEFRGLPQTPVTMCFRPGLLFEQEMKAILGELLGHFAEQVQILFDQPRGLALSTLNAPSSGPSPQQNRNLLVVTDSMSAEYLEDLWDHRPGLLATDVRSLTELQWLIKEAVRSGPLRWTPGACTQLTSAERRQLRALAQGRSNKAIARELDLSERTVHNTLTRIFNKLGVESRLEAALVYWGVGLRGG